MFGSRIRSEDTTTCELEEICTQNRDDRTAVLIRSYEFVHNYEKVTGTFYWINPKYNATVYGDKVIATHGTLDEEDTNQYFKILFNLISATTTRRRRNGVKQ